MKKTKNLKESAEDIKILNIGEKQYVYDSLTDAAKGLVNDLNIINDELKRQKTLVGITEIARGTVIKSLETELTNIEEFKPALEETETAEV